MSFEQQKNNEYFETEEHRKNKESRDQFFLEQKIMAESSNLLKKLAGEIAQKFGIDISKASELIESSTSGSLDYLKSSLSTHEAINTSELLKAISQAQNSIEDLSKKHRESLKEALDRENYSPEKHEFYTSETLFPPRILQKAKNPQNISDQFVGLGLGLIDSSEAIILFTYSLGKGVIFTPYHLYLLLAGKAKYEGFSKI